MGTDRFSPHRTKLRALAYRMLGSVAEAEDVLQDAYLRWHSAEDHVDHPEAWLTKTVTRLCLDRMKSARAKREVYVGPWLPEPIPTDTEEVDPESISVAFLLLLERLSPFERAVYLLHSVFEVEHAAIASMLGKSEAAVRQSFHRAKEHIQSGKPRFAPSKEAHARLLATFAVACQGLDVAGLQAVLAEDVEAWTDGGGKTRAARNVVHGANDVARFFVGVVKHGATASLTTAIEELNGRACIVVRDNGVPSSVVDLETDGTLIHAVHVMINPEKLSALQARVS